MNSHSGSRMERLPLSQEKGTGIQSSLLTYPAPSDVGLDEERPPEASEYPQQDEGGQLHQVPRGMKLHVEQHQTAVSKWVNGAQGEGCDQGGKERTPQCLQREIITHLAWKKGDTGKERGEKRQYYI